MTTSQDPDPSRGGSPDGSEPGDRGGSRLVPVLIGLVIAAILGLMVVLHLSGAMGPGMH